MSGLNETSSLLPDFSSLSPSLVAEAAEAVLGQPIDGTLVPYPSYVNRVYGLTTGDGLRVITKFYRPGRWTEEAIREEHAFVAECAAAGIPVPKALVDAEGEGLSLVSVEDEEGQERSFLFALYPFISGRGWEAETDEDWIQLGRLIAAIHAVGRKHAAPARAVIHPERSTRFALRRLLDGSFVHPDLRLDFEEACSETLDRIIPLFEGLDVHRLHGDLHRGNLLRCRWSSGEADGNGFAGMAIIDFDDMATGPAVQDLWLFLPGRLDESRRELGLILEGYEETLSFDRSQINLIEPLRFMRMIGYLDWQARQRADAGFLRAFPDWGSRPFWIKEVEDLRDQARIVIEGIG